MTNPDHHLPEDLPEGLEQIAARLRAERPPADPVRLDEIKRRVIARCSAAPLSRSGLRSRFAAIFTLLALLVGTAGAVAVGSKGTGNGYGYGASTAMYCTHKGKGKPCKPTKPYKEKKHKKHSVRAVTVKRKGDPGFTG